MAGLIPIIIGYTIFLFVLYSLQIMSSDSVIGNPNENANYSISTNSSTISSNGTDFFSLFDVSSDVGWINIFFLFPLGIILTYAGICIARGIPIL